MWLCEACICVVCCGSQVRGWPCGCCRSRCCYELGWKQRPGSVRDAIACTFLLLLLLHHVLLAL